MTLLKKLMNALVEERMRHGARSRRSEVLSRAAAPARDRRLFGLWDLFSAMSGARAPRLRRPQAGRRASADPRLPRRRTGDRRRLPPCVFVHGLLRLLRGS